MKRIYAIIECHAKNSLVPLDFPKPWGNPSGPLKMFPLIPPTVMGSEDDVIVYISSIVATEVVAVKTSVESAISIVVGADLVSASKSFEDVNCVTLANELSDREVDDVTEVVSLFVEVN